MVWRTINLLKFRFIFPDSATGENTAISAAYWLEAVPAFHATVSGELVGAAVGAGPEFSGPAANRFEVSR